MDGPHHEGWSALLAVIQWWAYTAYEPITDFTALVEAQPGPAGPNYRADIRTLDLVGDAGVAVFVGYFTVRCCAFGSSQSYQTRSEIPRA